MADRIQQRRDTAARWAQYNPILLEGEVGYVTDDPNQYKIGDGVHAWNELPLRGFDGTLVHELGTSSNAAMSQISITELFNEEYINTIGYNFSFNIPESDSSYYSEYKPIKLKKDEIYNFSIDAIESNDIKQIIIIVAEETNVRHNLVWWNNVDGIITGNAQSKKMEYDAVKMQIGVLFNTNSSSFIVNGNINTEISNVILSNKISVLEEDVTETKNIIDVNQINLIGGINTSDTAPSGVTVYQSSNTAVDIKKETSFTITWNGYENQIPSSVSLLVVDSENALHNLGRVYLNVPKEFVAEYDIKRIKYNISYETATAGNEVVTTNISGANFNSLSATQSVQRAVIEKNSMYLADGLGVSYILNVTGTALQTSAVLVSILAETTFTISVVSYSGNNLNSVNAIFHYTDDSTQNMGNLGTSRTFVASKDISSINFQVNTSAKEDEAVTLDINISAMNVTEFPSEILKTQDKLSESLMYSSGSISTWEYPEGVHNVGRSRQSLKKDVTYQFTLTNYKGDYFNRGIILGTGSEDSTRRQLVIINNLDTTISYTPNQDYLNIELEMYPTVEEEASVDLKMQFASNNDNLYSKVNRISEENTTLVGDVTTLKQNVKTNTNNIAKCLTTIPDDYITLIMLSQEIRSLLGGGGGSGSSFLPDGEDLTVNESNQLKFKDKSYDGSTSGLGRKYLRKNMVDNKNLLTSDMIQANSINILQYSYDLNGETLNVPSNAVILFQGGSISNGTIEGNNTIIVAPQYQIFSNISLEGTFKTTNWLVEWFGDCSSDCANAVIAGLKAINGLSNSNNYIQDGSSSPVLNAFLHFSNGTYNFNSKVNLNDVTTAFGRCYVMMSGEGKGSLIYNNYGADTFNGSDSKDLTELDYLFEWNPTNKSGYFSLYIKDMAFVGKKADSNQGLISTKGLAWVSRSIVENCYFRKMYDYINFSKSGYWNKIHGNDFGSCGVALKLTDANCSSITNNYISGCSVIGLYIDGGSGINIMGNDFSSDGIGLLISGKSSGESLNASNISIQGNYFETWSSTEQHKDIQIGESDSDICSDILIKCNSSLFTAPTQNDNNIYIPYGIEINGTLRDSEINGYIVSNIIAGVGNTGKIGYDSRTNAAEKISPYFSQWIDLTTSNREVK